MIHVIKVNNSLSPIIYKNKTVLPTSELVDKEIPDQGLGECQLCVPHGEGEGGGGGG